MRYPTLSQPTQRQPLDPRQVENSAGGYVYSLDPLKQLARFLVLGSDGPTYYASAQELTIDNAQCAVGCWEKQPHETAQLIREYRNRVAKLDPLLFALALGFCSTNEEARKQARIAARVCVTTGSQVFSLMKAVLSMRGTGRAVAGFLRDWYGDRDPDQLAYQMVKYRERQGLDHRMMLEIAHPRVGSSNTESQARGALYRCVRLRDKGKDLEDTHALDWHDGKLPTVFNAFLHAQDTDVAGIVKLIEEHNLPWEAIPTDKVRDPKVQRALIPRMPLNAFVRQLGLLSGAGVLEREDMQKLRDPVAVKKSKLHPFSVLLALDTYNRGRGMRSTWPVHGWVLEALDDLFYLCFGNVQPTGKRILLALDVSSSMSGSFIHNTRISAREAAAAMAAVTLAVEPNVDVMGFSHRLIELPLHKRMSLGEIVEKTRNIPFGRTDCALPMLEAIKSHRNYDAFTVYTDSETWCGGVHPKVALGDYRRHLVKDAKLIVVGLTATRFTIADPADPGMLDVVGFDSAAPDLMSQFISG